jgi:hypothetical protein
MKNLFLIIKGLVVGLLAFANTNVFATHLRAGEITVTQNCPSRTYKICITVYVNTNPAETDVEFGGGDLNFGDGTIHVTDGTPSTPFGDPTDFIGVVTYCIEHTYPAPGQYKITYNERNRNADIENMSNSVGTSFFIETLIEIDPFKGCNNSPRLLVPPIDKACSGAAWLHNPGAYDIDGDSLSYQIVVPRQGFEDKTNGPVGSYTLPNHQAHYAGFDYGNAEEDGSGAPDFAIDPITGTITWDAPGEAGEYNIAFLVIEWRKVNDVWLQIGYITRDMQIIVEDCDNERPLLEPPPDTCVVAGAYIEVPIYGTDPDFDDVKIEVYSETLILDVSPATYEPVDVFQSTSPLKAKITFKWKTECEHIKQRPYQVTLKITDKPASGGAKLVSFATWYITVVGPPPVWDQANIVANRSAQLNWDSYDCVVQADSMQVWRRIDSVAYDRENCLTGMPAGLGYEKIKTVPIGQTSYLDTNSGKGLPPGAVVCYRLVAMFPAPLGNTAGGSESLVSDEICVGPILVDAPVMTHVTVDTTSTTKGRITVRWTPPFDLDPLAFPPPYTYDVYRATGFSGNIGLVQVGTAKQTDTVMVDRLINTFDNVYNYRVFAYDNTGTMIDTSAVASSVRLQAKSLLEKIELIWTAQVPWSLRSSINPRHIIYRGGENDKEGQFVKIDSIEASQSLLMYTDDGNGTPLVENQKYCYRVETRGGYGFDDTSKIPEPLINFSQIVCAQAKDDDPPCQPELALNILSCDEYYATYGCAFNDFSNVLVWSRPDDVGCRNDISHYRIYYSTKANGVDSVDYKLLVDLADRPLDTSYVDRNLPSFARCYKLVAVDRSGNESDWSNEVCNDNCPNYQLPNVFTPGFDDNCNNFFSAYSDRSFVEIGSGGEGSKNISLLCNDVAPSGEFLEDLKSRCPRFVLRVDVTIVDRWGKQVFTYASGGRNNIYIDWDGVDSNGKELPSGVYFYSANVTFETLDPKDSEKIIKGWVHLIRTGD